MFSHFHNQPHGFSVTAHACWLLGHSLLRCGQYASYWNAFLFFCHPQTKLREGNVSHVSVILSTVRGGEVVLYPIVNSPPLGRNIRPDRQ